MTGESSDARLNTSTKIARMAMFTAAAVVSGYLLMMVPNVELISAVVALAGLLMGVGPGATVGVFALMIYGALNAWGPTNPPLWIAQMLGMGLIGMLAGLIRPAYSTAGRIKPVIITAAAGLAGTLIYDLLTNLSWPLATGIKPGEGWIPFLISGLAFAVIHLVSNTLIFALVVPVAYARLKPLMEGER